METKVCSRCNRTKQESEFSKRKSSKLSSDGLQTYSKDCSKIHLSRWQQNNREHNNANMRERYRCNEGHQTAQLNRQRVYRAIKYSKQIHNRVVKAHSTLSLLGAPSWNFVNQWLDITDTTEEGDTTSVKHIDHFIPCARLDLSDPEQQRECFNWANVRIMPASENISKNAKLPSKAEYRKHIKTCLLFADWYKLREKTEQLAVFRLVYNTACRVFPQCL